ncbi:hypothetical protein EDM80_02240 [bacterium]|nr:MAG: hypothetical protein EDM80_02240 [bacterium]RIK62333.1 MAG: hypothetical protein DCC64_10425 [Planctomycetota bacterium]
MARDIGKARKADLSGHFAGEQHDALAPLVRFLIGARQLNDVEEGKTPGSGDTSLNLAAASGTDTEAYPAAHVMNNGHEGNGHARPPAGELAPAPEAETDVFGDEILRQPEQELTPAPLEAAPDDAPTPGNETAIDVAPVSSSDTVHDDTLRAEPESALAPEPEAAPLSLDATEPGFALAPEAEEVSAADTVFDTRLPEPEAAPPTVRPEAETRILTPREVKREQELSPETDKLETGKLKLAPEDMGEPAVEEETSVVKSADDPEKITTKVDPNSAAAKAPQGGVMRDTVNFYNQTQALRDLLDGSPRPVPALPPGTTTTKIPVPGRPIAQADLVPLENDAGQDELPVLGESLEPADIEPPAPAPPVPQAVQDEHDEQTRAFLRDEIAPVHSDTDEAPELPAAEESEAADRKDTDRFRLADLRPADLPVPEGTDKIEKPPARAGEPLLVAPEADAARRDTQKFFVSDLIGVATFKPAPKPVPLADDSDPDEAAVSSGSTTGSDTALDRTSSETESEPRPAAPLPKAREVETDFVVPRPDSGTRIVPELVSARAPAKPSEKITEKVKQEEAKDTDKLPPPVEPEESAETPVRKITDALTRRMRQERDETRKLIDEAEGVLLKLRQTPTSTRQARVEAAPAPARSERAAVPPPMPEAAEAPSAAAGLPPLEEIASATIHDLRLAEELLEASKAISAAQSTESKASAVLREVPAEPQGLTLRKALSQRDGNGHARPVAEPDMARAPSGEPDGADVLTRIEQRLGGAARSLDEILNSTSAALKRVTGEISREELEERRRAREQSRRPSRKDVLRSSLLDEEFASGLGDEPLPDKDPYEGLSLDELVAAASSLRQAVHERDERASRRRTASGRAIVEEEPLSRRTSARLAASALAEELERVRTEAIRRSTRVQSARESANIPRQDIGLELTQGPLWQTLVGIGGVTLFLTGLFIWVWYMMATRV